jgi:rubrerythrin
LTNSAGVPWTAAYIDTIGEPTADLRSNIAAEARAKIVYERLMNVTDDPGISEALGFLMTREIAHQKSFEKALHSIQPNFPQGKLPGVAEYTNVYYNMSNGDDSPRGPWNEGPNWEFVENPQPAVDGGDGLATVQVSKQEVEVLSAMASRTASATTSDPVTGADLGAGQEAAIQKPSMLPSSSQSANALARLRCSIVSACITDLLSHSLPIGKKSRGHSASVVFASEIQPGERTVVRIVCSRSKSTGFVRWWSKPAAAASSLSFSCPQPEMATSRTLLARGS